MTITFKQEGNKVFIYSRGRIWDIKVCQDEAAAKEWKEQQEWNQLKAMLP